MLVGLLAFVSTLAFEEAAAADPDMTERSFGDWKVVEAREGGPWPWATTGASVVVWPDGRTTSDRDGPTKTAVLMVSCEKEGHILIRPTSMVLILMGGRYPLSVRYDDAPFESMDRLYGDIDATHLNRMSAGKVVQVQWAIPEGPVTATFSLAGAPDALRIVAAACDAPFGAPPRPRAAVEPAAPTP